MKGLVIVTSLFPQFKVLLWDKFLQHSSKQLLEVEMFVGTYVEQADERQNVIRFELSGGICWVVAPPMGAYDYRSRANRMMARLMEKNCPDELFVAARLGWINWDSLRGFYNIPIWGVNFQHIFRDTPLHLAMEEFAHTISCSLFEKVCELIKDNHTFFSE